MKKYLSLIFCSVIISSYSWGAFKKVYPVHWWTPVEKSKAGVPEGNQAVANDIDSYGTDPTLKELLEKLVRIYQRGDSQKRAHLMGFLNGADPGE